MKPKKTDMKVKTVQHPAGKNEQLTGYRPGVAARKHQGQREVSTFTVWCAAVQNFQAGVRQFSRLQRFQV